MQLLLSFIEIHRNELSDDESGDDYLCDKDKVTQWFNIPWNGVTHA